MFLAQVPFSLPSSEDTPTTPGLILILFVDSAGASPLEQPKAKGRARGKDISKANQQADVRSDEAAEQADEPGANKDKPRTSSFFLC